MLEQVKEKKAILEKQILELIQNFENETGAYISDIEILSNVWQTANGRSIETSQVEINIKI